MQRHLIATGMAALLTLGALVSPLAAQSTVTLPSFSLDEDPPAGTDLEAAPNCLRTPDHPDCGGAQTSGRAFSLSDVVNLGIIDRSEIETEAAAQGEEVVIEAAVEPLPSVDIQILFDYASSDLRADQVPPLVSLAQDLRGIDFSRARLVVMGHTDGVGSYSYNQQLSRERADSVARFLARTAGIPAGRIRTSGMAFDYLLLPDDPANPANRRVQVLLVE